MIPVAVEAPDKRGVVVVEDEVLLRIILADSLRDAGLHVVEAPCGDDALAYLRTGGRAELVFSDVETPGVVNGVKLAEVVQKDFPGVPVILTSGRVMPGEASGCALFIPKPYDIDRVVSSVIEHLVLGDAS